MVQNSKERSYHFINLSGERNWNPSNSFGDTIAPQDVSSQLYWFHWDAFELVDGILYRKWETPNLKTSVRQLVVPREKIKKILEEAHDSYKGEHFGVNKTLEKIWKQFYWATCKLDVEN